MSNVQTPLQRQSPTSTQHQSPTVLEGPDNATRALACARPPPPRSEWQLLEETGWAQFETRPLWIRSKMPQARGLALTRMWICSNFCVYSTQTANACILSPWLPSEASSTFQAEIWWIWWNMMKHDEIWWNMMKYDEQFLVDWFA